VLLAESHNFNKVSHLGTRATWLARSGTQRAFIEGVRRARMATDTKSQFEPHIGRSVSLDHAAQLLGVSRRTIYNRIRDNRLKTVRTAGGSQRVLIDSLAGDGQRIEATTKRG